MGRAKGIKNIFLNNPSQALAWLDEDFKELAFLNWTNNFGNSFGILSFYSLRNFTI